MKNLPTYCLRDLSGRPVNLNVSGLRNSSGRHVVKMRDVEVYAAEDHEREIIVKGVHETLNDVDNMVFYMRHKLICVYTWQRIDGRTFRYRWTPEFGWQMLKPEQKSWYTFK